MKHTLCPHASSGCNAPEGECNGACMTEKKSPDNLLIAVSNAIFATAVGPNSDADDALLSLHALCEAQKKLLEQAHECLQGFYDWTKHKDTAGAVAAKRTCDAITAHLLQQEGEKK